MKYLILKLTQDKVEEHMLSHTPLKDLMTGPWRITTKRLQDVNNVLILFNQIIIGEHLLGDTYVVSKRQQNNICLEFLEDVDTGYIGKQIKYPTSNKASVISKEKLDNLISEYLDKKGTAHG